MTPTCGAYSTAPRSLTSPPSSRTARPTQPRLHRRARRSNRLLHRSGYRRARNLRRDPRMALPSRPPTTRSRPSSSAGGSSNGSTGCGVEDHRQLATKYTDQPYPRGQERVVAVIEADHPRAPTAGPGLIRRAGPHATLLLPKNSWLRKRGECPEPDARLLAPYVELTDVEEVARRAQERQASRIGNEN